MKRMRVLSSSRELTNEFERCCNEYDSLHFAVAWCGNPQQTLPFMYLECFSGKILATIGVSFKHTHPNAIDWLMGRHADIRIYRDNAALFHPKVYLFSSKARYALFVGSSNLTYSGFYTNEEVNVLIESSYTSDKDVEIKRLEKRLIEWRSNKYKKWLEKYNREYLKRLKMEKKYKIRTPTLTEGEVAPASWVKDADWNVYYMKVCKGLKKGDSVELSYHDVLDAAEHLLPIPWKLSHFDDLEKRRVIGGMGKYGWLGHVAASGQFRKLLAGSKKKPLEIIAQCINTISQFNHPVPWNQLESNLNKLCKLGQTMKVWGRLLCLVRPDLFCTVASTSVRQELSVALHIPQKQFETPEGYILLIKFIHSSPWFNSDRPKGKKERAIWERRVAFIDAITYD